MANQTKVCNACEREKSLIDFYPKTGIRGTRYAGTAAGVSHQCKECDRKARLYYVAAFPDKAKQSDRGYHLSRYNLNVHDYNALFINQAGCCLGCNRHQTEINKRLCVDHDHITGKVRGLLCHSCNALLGMAKDKTSTLSNLINYLTNFSESAANKINTDTKVG